MTPEITTYLERLNDLRRKILKEVEGLDATALDWTPLPQDTNSLFVLAVHSVGAEHGWIGELIGGEPKTRVRPLEFQARGDGVAELRVRVETTAHESERILSAVTENDLNATLQHEAYGTVAVRWGIVHVLEHYSEHLGQMRLTRQLWEKRNST